MRPAPKTVVKTFLIIHREGWTFFLMKRATSLKFPSRPRQLGALADDIGQRHAGADFVEKGFGQIHGYYLKPIHRRRKGERVYMIDIMHVLSFHLGKFQRLCPSFRFLYLIQKALLLNLCDLFMNVREINCFL